MSLFLEKLNLLNILYYHNNGGGYKQNKDCGSIKINLLLQPFHLVWMGSEKMSDLDPQIILVKLEKLGQPILPDGIRKPVSPIPMTPHRCFKPFLIACCLSAKHRRSPSRHESGKPIPNPRNFPRFRNQSQRFRRTGQWRYCHVFNRMNSILKSTPKKCAWAMVSWRHHPGLGMSCFSHSAFLSAGSREACPFPPSAATLPRAPAD